MKSDKWYNLLDRLGMRYKSPMDDVIDMVLRQLDAAEKRIEELEDQVSTLDSIEHLPDELAARLVHSQHSDTYLVDLSLCCHPDCTRLWSGV